MKIKMLSALSVTALMLLPMEAYSIEYKKTCIDNSEYVIFSSPDVYGNHISAVQVMIDVDGQTVPKHCISEEEKLRAEQERKQRELEIDEAYGKGAYEAMHRGFESGVLRNNKQAEEFLQQYKEKNNEIRR